MKIFLTIGCLISWIPLAAASVSAGSAIQEIWVSTPSALNRTVEFAYRMPQHPAITQSHFANRQPNRQHDQVLMLVRGYNGSGKAWITGENAWTRFADREGMILLAPTFKTDVQEVHSHKGYYYPELWSGKATLEALRQLHERTGADVKKILLFGFSAGAHFTHGFALWKPGRVKAFVAYSGGWWSKPTAALRDVPALILCGEADPRLEPTLEFFQEGAALHLPWIWRSYAGLGHEMRPEIIRMSEAFLAYYAKEHSLTTSDQTNQMNQTNTGKRSLTVNAVPTPLTTSNAPKNAISSKSWVGDIQTYETYPAGSTQAKQIPQEERVVLPSAQLAKAWRLGTAPASHH